MLSAPDFLEKQIAFIDIMKERQLSLTNGNLLIKEGNMTVNKISISKLFCLFIVGDCTFSTKLINALQDYNVSIYVLWPTLKPKFLIGDGLEGNYVLRGKQYHSMIEFKLARAIIQNKISNQLALLKSLREKDDDLKTAIVSCTDILAKTTETINAGSMRGFEWNVAKLFFSNYFKPIWRYGRMPRTRNDIPNLLLDIGYTMIYNIVEAHLHLYGFDIYKGVYHTDFFERKSLVCDLVEPFRCLIDRQLRKAYNLGQIDEKDFVYKNAEYNIKFEARIKYVRLLLSPVITHREAIFRYVKSFYASMMASDPALLVPFNIDA